MWIHKILPCLPQGDANMHSWIGSALVQAIAWHRFIVNWKNNEQASVKFDIKYQHFLSENYIWKYCLKNVHFVLAQMLQKESVCEGFNSLRQSDAYMHQ